MRTNHIKNLNIDHKAVLTLLTIFAELYLLIPNKTKLKLYLEISENIDVNNLITLFSLSQNSSR